MGRRFAGPVRRLTDRPAAAAAIAATEPGDWMVTRNRLVREVLQDPETFSSLHLTGWSNYSARAGS